MSDQHRTTEDDALNRILPDNCSPGAVAEAMEDPDVFAQVARGDLYVQLAMMRRLAASKSFSTSQRLDYARFLARMGKVEKPEEVQNQFANVPAINIVLPNAGQTTQIGTAARVVNPDEASSGD